MRHLLGQAVQRVHKDSPLPLYYQLKELLKRGIEQEAYHPHDRLPSEIELSKQFDVSRMTARRALVDLENEGFVYREPGRGTFVAEPKLRQGLLRLTSFTEDIKSRGMTPGARVREVALVREARSATRLGVPEDAPLVKVQRLRLADGSPLALETSHLVHRLCLGIEALDLADRSLYRLLHERYGLTLGRAEQYIEAKPAGPLEAEVLNLDKGKSVLLMERTAFLDDDRTAVEFVESVYRSDRYRFYVELKAG